MNIQLSKVEEIDIEINGELYPANPRTVGLEEKLYKLDEKKSKMTLLDFQKETIVLILGQDAFDEIFPKADEINLDFLEAVYYGAIEGYAYNNTKREKEMQKQANDVQMEQLKDIVSASKDLAPLLNATDNLNREQKRNLKKATK